MKNIFEQGEFTKYSKENLTESRKALPIKDSYNFSKKVTVFISHKHDDLEDLKGIIGFLEKYYNVQCYIDSKDSTLPKITSMETANELKEKIKDSDKFIFLATNGAVESKWCNWELGFGDACKFPHSIAIISIKPKNNDYKGSEFLEAYPCIVERIYGDKYSDGELITPGYYIREKQKDGSYNLTELSCWLNKK